MFAAADATRPRWKRFHPGSLEPYRGRRNPLSDTTDVTSGVNNATAPEETAGASRRRRTGGGLTSMLLPELQAMAASLGISGTARMRKGELIAAIQERGDGRVPGPRNTGGDHAPADVRDKPARSVEQARSVEPEREFAYAGEPVARTAEPVAHV